MATTSYHYKLPSSRRMVCVGGTRNWEFTSACKYWLSSFFSSCWLEAGGRNWSAGITQHEWACSAIMVALWVVWVTLLIDGSVGMLNYLILPLLTFTHSFVYLILLSQGLDLAYALCSPFQDVVVFLQCTLQLTPHPHLQTIHSI